MGAYNPWAKSNRKRTKRWLRKRAAKLYNKARKPFAQRLATLLPSVSKQLHAARYRRSERKVVGLIERPRPLRPDFLIIGSPKCGTTWLNAILDQHPEVVTVRDEIEYFSNHFYYPVEWYYEHFAERLGSADKVKHLKTCVLGEKSAHYCSMPRERIKAVRKLFPDVRLILMTRHPISRHWSHAKRYFAKQRLRNPELAVLDTPRSNLLAFFERERLAGEFSKIIENWAAHFPSGQLLVLSQEKTLASPKETFDAVLKHIGASTDYDPSHITFLSQQRNRGPKVKMPEDVAEHLAVMYADEQKWLREFFGDRHFVYAA